MKIYLDTVGCRLNQSEIETYARQLRAAGHTLVATLDEADQAIVNTCTVTTQAASDSRGKIRRAYRAGVDGIVVTGCWATLDPQAAAALPGVTSVVPNADKEDLVPVLLQIPSQTFDLEPLARVPVPGARLRTRATLKVQDGCDNRCTYCVITLARGEGRSRTMKQVMAEVNIALRGGAKEIVLTGVHLGSWGHDFDHPQQLYELVETILLSADVPRLRLSSLEPWDLTPDFFSLWEDSRLCRHLHLPLQSGSAGVLRRMARKTTPQAFGDLVEAARQAIPDLAITTDLIAGFPGETEEEFAQTLDFVRRMDFARGHVFTYSARPGTAAAEMSGQVPHPLRKDRNAQLRAVLADSEAQYRAKFIGQTLPVLWESAALNDQTWTLKGLTDNYLSVTAQAPQDLWNQITPAQLTNLTPNGLSGVITLERLNVQRSNV